jgi:hypothetical protein
MFFFSWMADCVSINFWGISKTMENMHNVQYSIGANNGTVYINKSKKSEKIIKTSRI